MKKIQEIRNEIYEIGHWHKKYLYCEVFEEVKYLQIVSLLISKFERKYSLKEGEIFELFTINENDEIIVCSDEILFEIESKR